MFHPYFKTFEENSDKFNYSTWHLLLGTISIHLIKFITMLICKYMAICICVVNENEKILETNCYNL